MAIEKLRRVSLRDVWRHEARDFTTWLEENPDVLSEAVDFTIVSVEREQSAGTFSVDLVAEDESGRTVVIENQLEKSDHDHLGKVLTYLAALDAKAAVWIVAQPRPEHIKAVNWLNESTDTPFYLLQIEAVKIGDSAPAPLLTRIVGPSTETRAAGVKRQELSERNATRYRFWEGLLEHAKAKTTLFAQRVPNTAHYLGVASGVVGTFWTFVARQHDSSIELYIDRLDGEMNLAIFNGLLSHREKIEKALGEPLEWQELDTRRACRVMYRLDAGGGMKDEHAWDTIYERLVDGMIRFEAALGPVLKKLKI